MDTIRTLDASKSYYIANSTGEIKEAGAVMFNLSQSALARLKDGLKQYGIGSSEHSPVEYTLSKDENTSAVKIDIKSPGYLPIEFSWSVTVAIDGTTTSTPMNIVDKRADGAHQEMKAGLDG
ncbi:MAG: hypothetical protein IJP66_06375 [Kiritimatiellae bacterium]|nr:hypothetical protein [Kiritimatiellia bacterium]